jgi:hypothetical protein
MLFDQPYNIFYLIFASYALNREGADSLTEYPIAINPVESGRKGSTTPREVEVSVVILITDILACARAILAKTRSDYD